jgi:hypothetical protein
MTLNRDSQFPDRRSVIRGEAVQQAASPASAPVRVAAKAASARLRKPLLPVVWVFFLITLISGSLPYLEEAFEAVSGYFTAEQPPPAKPTGISPRTPAELSAGIEKTEPKPAVKPVEVVDSKGDLNISIASAFRPVGFVVPARSHKLPLADSPDRLYKRLPRFSGTGQKYGAVRLMSGQEYRFALDMLDEGFQLYLDSNRNGDLTDDGAPLGNAGTGLFANKLQFPLSRVTGIAQLSGDYELWVFTNNQSWSENSLRAYARTQLSGQLKLGGNTYRAYLADNHLLDGDFTNDGIGIDLNGDGKIESLEYLPPGGQIKVGDRTYRVNITR